MSVKCCILKRHYKFLKLSMCVLLYLLRKTDFQFVTFMIFHYTVKLLNFGSLNKIAWLILAIPASGLKQYTSQQEK